MYINEVNDYNINTNRYIEICFNIFTNYAVLQIDPIIPG